MSLGLAGNGGCGDERVWRGAGSYKALGLEARREEGCSELLLKAALG